jgi:hypothetical protein
MCFTRARSAASISPRPISHERHRLLAQHVQARLDARHHHRMVQILRHDHHQRIQFATVDHRPVVGVDLGYVVLLGQSLGATPIATTYCAYAGARMRAQSRKVEVGDPVAGA